MLLSITTTHQPATDLGWLLHKHPDKLQEFSLSMGKAHVFYPEKSDARCTACLLLDINPVDLVRGGKQLSGDFALGNYVNDRPYVASSFMSVAIAKAYSSALNGNCKDRPELPAMAMPFEVEISSLPAPRGGEALIRNLFEPLGYVVELEQLPLDPQFPSWGNSRYFHLRLQGTVTLQILLSHLYVLIPVLDNDKHYFVGKDEIEKLLNKGEGWLQNHPEKEQIARRYFSRKPSLGRRALERLSIEEERDETEEANTESSEIRERKLSLHEQRLDFAVEKLIESGAQSVLDLGCGEGKLIRKLIKHGQFKKIAGMDVSYRELLKAKDRLHYEEMSPRQKERIQLFQGSLSYRDARMEGFDAIALVEVIEHLDPHQLERLEQVVFGCARASTVVLTTPNSEYNVVWEKLSAGTFRHADHRFEWTRAEFKDWAESVARKHNYEVLLLPVGEEAADIGSATQMAIFKHGN